MATHDELVRAVSERYGGASREERGHILDEFTAVKGLHRKHAVRLLRGGAAVGRCGPRPGRLVYDVAVREALVVVWEASDRVCGKRLRPLVPLLIDAMGRHGHLRLAPEVRGGLLAMSAATIDRALTEVRGQAGGGARRRASPSAGVRRSVPVRTFAGWDDPAPGFMEADLVAHSGPTAEGSFLQTLTLTDIATGWTECAPLLVCEQTLLTEVLREVRKRLPFPLLGFDTDNDSVFMNETVRDYCAVAGIAFMRCRPYRKNDQAWVEQKNGAVVRRIAGYRRYVGFEAVATLGRLYGSVRLFVNFFQPSFELAGKVRDGAKVTKRYHAAATPYQRLMANPRTSCEHRSAGSRYGGGRSRTRWCLVHLLLASRRPRLPRPNCNLLRNAEGRSLMGRRLQAHFALNGGSSTVPSGTSEGASAVSWDGLVAANGLENQKAFGCDNSRCLGSIFG